MYNIKEKLFVFFITALMMLSIGSGHSNAAIYGGATPPPLSAGTGLSLSGSNVISNAEQTITFQPGGQTAIVGAVSAFVLFKNASTVDNIAASALTFTCSGNPTLTLYECGTSSTCATPTAIGTVTITAANTAVTGTITSAAITAGDYVAWKETSGTCSILDIAGSAQIHSN